MSAAPEGGQGDAWGKAQALRPLVIVVAVARNGVIGRDGGLPWRLPEDLRRFKALTMGHPVILGRRTHASIGRALPGRRNLVVSRQAGLLLPGCEVVGSLDEALRRAWEGDGVPHVIGGASLYAEALPRATHIELTEVHAEPEGDTHFPPLPPGAFVEVAREEADGCSFVTLRRR